MEDLQISHHDDGVDTSSIPRRRIWDTVGFLGAGVVLTAPSEQLYPGNSWLVPFAVGSAVVALAKKNR